MGGEGKYKHMHTNTVEVQHDCNSIAEVLPPYSGKKILEVHLAGKNLK